MGNIDFVTSPTGAKFHASKAFVRGLMGPLGSGKSVTCCMEIFSRAQRQEPSKDGVRRSKWVIVRNTQPELETTTLKTWLDWFPEEVFGKLNRKPPFKHSIKISDIELEVIFLALDKPQDVKKLLSLECTGIWFNEAREINYELLSAATGRVGRYPSQKDRPEHIKRENWPTWNGVILDTNPPSDQHWWYRMAENQEWAVDKFGNPVDPQDIDDGEKWEFFKQPSGLSPEAENINNLPGGRKYYERMLGGKGQDWINIYVHGNYGYVKEGMPVYKTSYNPDVHAASEDITLRPHGTIFCGIDASGRHPAAVFAQKNIHGQVQVIDEIAVTTDEGMGAVRFAEMLKAHVNKNYSRHDIEFYGDPAGGWKSQNDEQTYFQILEGRGIRCKPSPLLRVPERIETVIYMLEQMPGGKPLMIIAPKCKTLIRGFNGGYRYRRLNVSGDSRYEEKPDKNRYSDAQDALQYMLGGMGYGKVMYNSHTQETKTVFASTAFTV